MMRKDITMQKERIAKRECVGMEREDYVEY